MAPTYITAIVTVLVNVQGLVGLHFVTDQWTAFITVSAGIYIAVRQLVTKRARVLGGRPWDFRQKHRR